MIDDLVYLAAFRYALGRSSYIVVVIADELIKAELSEETKKTIVREIKEDRTREEGFVVSNDRKQWLRVKEKFIKDLT